MMVIAPLLDQQGLNLAVPEVVDQQQVTKDPKIMNVTVTSDNKFIWNGQEFAAENLEELFAKRKKTNFVKQTYLANYDILVYFLFSTLKFVS